MTRSGSETETEDVVDAEPDAKELEADPDETFVPTPLREAISAEEIEPAEVESEQLDAEEASTRDPAEEPTKVWFIDDPLDEISRAELIAAGSPGELSPDEEAGSDPHEPPVVGLSWIADAAPDTDASANAPGAADVAASPEAAASPAGSGKGEVTLPTDAEATDAEATEPDAAETEPADIDVSARAGHSDIPADQTSDEPESALVDEADFEPTGLAGTATPSEDEESDTAAFEEHFWEAPLATSNQPRLGFETELEAETEPDLETEPGPETEAETVSGVEAEAASEAEAVSEAETVSAAEIESERPLWPTEPSGPALSREAESLRSVALPRLKDLLRRLTLDRHGALLDDRLTHDRPSLRFRVEPRRGPFDEEDPQAAVLEIAADSDDATTARFWLDPLSTRPTEQRSTDGSALNDAWLDRVVLDFVEQAFR